MKERETKADEIEAAKTVIHEKRKNQSRSKENRIESENTVGSMGKLEEDVSLQDCSEALIPDLVREGLEESKANL